MIEFSGVGYSGGGRTLLEDFSWQLPDPGIYLLLGANGSGKSLLSSMLAGRIRAQRGLISIIGEPVARMGGQVWLADAGQSLTDDETVEEYVEYEMAASGTGGDRMTLCMRRLDNIMRGIADIPLSRLPHHALLITQIAIASMIDAPLRILDGHFTYFDATSCRHASRLLHEFSARQEHFMLLTASRLASDLPEITSGWLLSGEQPLSLTRLDGSEWIDTGLHLLPTSTAVNVYFSNMERPPLNLSSGRSFRILSRLEGGMNIELTGSIDECLHELAVLGIEIRRIDLQQT